jgi:hypothetical protein
LRIHIRLPFLSSEQFSSRMQYGYGLSRFLA